MDEPRQETLLTIKQVAERTQVPVETIRWLRQQGRFAPTVKVDRRLLWDVTDLDAWLIAQQQRWAEAGTQGQREHQAIGCCTLSA